MINRLKAWFQSLTPETRKYIVWFIVVSSLVAAPQGLMNALEPVKISSRGCQYEMFWDYHPARVVLCELLRKRGETKTFYSGKKKR